MAKVYKQGIDTLTDAEMRELVGRGDESMGVDLENPTGQPEPKFDRGKLRPIQMNLIAAFPLLPFPIYVHSDSEQGFSLLVSKGSRFSESIQKRIEKQSKGPIYVQAKDYPAFLTTHSADGLSGVNWSVFSCLSLLRWNQGRWVVGVDP